MAETLKTPSPSAPSSTEIFNASITKIAMAQICQSIGFTTSQQSALESLSNIATRYLQTLAKQASLSANTSGRTQCNLFDVIYAIEDMSSIQGFKGVSNLNRSLFKSGALLDIKNFVSSIEEIPFAKPIPRRHSAKESDISRKLGKCEQVRTRIGPHIPIWVPRFPDLSTYKEETNSIVREIESEKVLLLPIERSEMALLLPIERAKVKFKLRNGACRGGKRVYLDSEEKEG
ncbi:hypothetical protein GIB67_024919 [Kingdonia uniflora]|uniref:Bromodomain associated domain-containing protein n=1 Tax=Kingdonia uniflora TaxID=39325 RepID=A0A7J7NYQ2_9MAGN|nr:hypothetical protein GIB67_024919 [Kingdonia uniflora]